MSSSCVKTWCVFCVVLYVRGVVWCVAVLCAVCCCCGVGVLLCVVVYTSTCFKHVGVLLVHTEVGFIKENTRRVPANQPRRNVAHMRLAPNKTKKDVFDDVRGVVWCGAVWCAVCCCGGVGVLLCVVVTSTQTERFAHDKATHDTTTTRRGRDTKDDCGTTTATMTATREDDATARTKMTKRQEHNLKQRHYDSENDSDRDKDMSTTT